MHLYGIYVAFMWHLCGIYVAVCLLRSVRQPVLNHGQMDSIRPGKYQIGQSDTSKLRFHFAHQEKLIDRNILQALVHRILSCCCCIMTIFLVSWVPIGPQTNQTTRQPDKNRQTNQTTRQTDKYRQTDENQTS